MTPTLGKILEVHPYARLAHRVDKDGYGWPVLATVFATNPNIVYLAGPGDLTTPIAVARSPRRPYHSLQAIESEWQAEEP